MAASSKPPATACCLDAYDLYLRVLALRDTRTDDSVREAIALLKRALAIDPNYAPAKALIGWSRIHQASHGRSPVSEGGATEAVTLARDALEAGKDDADTLWMAAHTLSVFAGEHTVAAAAIDRALMLNPNSAHAWMARGFRYGGDNQPGPAIEALERARRLSPLDPQPWVFYGGLAHAHFAAGRWGEAIEWADRALHAQPRMTAVVGVKAAACSHLGRAEEARAYVSRYLELRPGSTIGNVGGYVRTAVSPEFRAAYTDGLRQAGMPEE